jgi:dihydroorotase-like cyclic amidohydrolase
MLPIMLTHVNHGLISIGGLVRVMSENVARIFGLYPRKGKVRIGADADFVVVDLKKRKKLKAEEFYTKAKDIARVYDGVEVEGLPVATYVNGVEVMSDGEVSGKPGTGKFVRPDVTGQGMKPISSKRR